MDMSENRGNLNFRSMETLKMNPNLRIEIIQHLTF